MVKSKRLDKNIVDWVIPISLLLSVILLKYPTADLPYHWDETQFIGGSNWMSKNRLNFNLPPAWDLGHPPLVYEILAIAYIIFGHTPFVSHMVIAGFSFVGVYYTYLLGSHLSNRLTGLIGAALLLCSPMYMSLSGETLLDMPATAVGIAALYYAIKGRTMPYLISGTMLVLLKESGILVVASTLIYVILQNIRDRKKLVKQTVLYSLPAITLIGWIAYHHLQAGFTLATGVAVFFHNPEYICYWAYIIAKSLLFDDFRLITTSFIFFAVIFKRRHLKNQGFLLLFLMILVSVIGFSFLKALYLPRYIIIAYPPYFLLSAVSLTVVSRKTGFLIPATAILILLFYSRWSGERTHRCGAQLEINMGYVESVRASMYAADYISKNYPNARILTAWPQTFYLGSEKSYYVKKPFHVIRISEMRDDQPLEGIDLIVYPQQISHIDSPKLARFIHKNKEDIRLLKRFEVNGKYVEVYKVDKQLNIKKDLTLGSWHPNLI